MASNVLSACECVENRGSYMSAHVLLNLLNGLRKRDNARLAKYLISFLETSLINGINKSTNVRFYLSYGIRATLKSHFWRKNL